MRILAALLAGVIFGIGLTLSQMVDPNKVLNFLDWFGTWDPSLAFVMGGAVITTMAGYPLILKREKPLLETFFDLPAKTWIDKRLLIGASLFGIGWGISGYCPGPAMAGLTINFAETGVFVLSLLVGFVLVRKLSL